MKAIIQLPAEADTDVICEMLEKDAALILDDGQDADQVAQIRAELAPYLEDGGEGRDDFPGFQTKRIGALIARSSACRKLALVPPVNVTAKQYLVPHAENCATRVMPGSHLWDADREPPPHKIARSLEPELQRLIG